MMPRRQRDSGIPFSDLYGGKFVGKKYTKRTYTNTHRRSGRFSVWTFRGVKMNDLNIRRRK